MIKIIVICSIIIILIVVIILLLKNNKNLKIYNNEYLKELKKQKSKNDDIFALNDILNSHIYEFNKLNDAKPTKEIKSKMKLLERTIKEDYNNLNVFCNPYRDDIKIHKSIINLTNELVLLKNELEADYKDIKINIHFIRGVNEYLKGDSVKLLSVLHILIQNVMTYTSKKEINLEISLIEDTRKRQRILISIDDVNFLEENPNLSNQDIVDYFNEKDFENVNYRLKILKENILYMNGKAILNYGLIKNEQSYNNFSIDVTFDKPTEDIYAIVVDDMKEMAKLNQRVLKEINIKSDIVFSATECIKKIIENPDKYDIVFTDYQMPEIDGKGLLKKLKEIEEFNLPVVVVTSEAGIEKTFNMYGFSDYIVKPMTKEEVSEKIKKLI